MSHQRNGQKSQSEVSLGRNLPCLNSFLRPAIVLRQNQLWLALAIITGIGAGLRTIEVFSSAGVYGDGGLFAVMISDLYQAGGVLPLHSSFNGGTIPFAYPPLMLYIGAALEGLGAGQMMILRLLPLFFSILTIPAVYLSAKALSRDCRLALVATFVWAVFPLSYHSLVMGGGLTRSPGQLFALLAIWQGIRIITARPGPGKRAVFLCGLFVGLGALCHPEPPVLVFASLGALWLVLGARLQTLRPLALSALIAIMVASPYLVLTIERFGPGVFLSALETNQDFFHRTLSPLIVILVYPLALPIFPALGMGLGLWSRLRKKDLAVPAMLLSMFLLDYRASSAFAVFGLGLLVAYALRTLVSAFHASVKKYTWPQLGRGLSWALPVILLVAGLGADMLPSAPMDNGLNEADLSALSALSSQAPAGTLMVSVPGISEINDNLSEWLPAYADVRNLAVGQGLEWTTDDSSARTGQLDRGLVNCSQQGGACLQAVLFTYGVAPKSVWIYLLGPGSASSDGRDDCAPLRAALLSDSSYRLIYDGPGATIFAPKSSY